MVGRSAFLALSLALLLSLSAPALAGKRVGLVIGNGAYASSPLRNPVNDAKDVAAALKKLGFAVLLKTDADRRAMVDAAREFEQQAAGAEAALFFYAGHGMQVRGANYLVPVGANVARENEVEFEAVDANLVLNKLESSGARVVVVILDACRDNPFRGFRSSARGLAVLNAGSGSVIAYATRPGDVAADGSGRNSPFTKHLLQHLATPGLTVKGVFDRVGAGVQQETGGRQVPWISSSLYIDFFLAGPAPASPAGPSPDAQGRPAGAAARLAVAESQYRRMQDLFANNLVTRQDLEQARAGYLQALADATPTQAATAPDGRKAWIEPATGMEFAWVPGGCFRMGSPDSARERRSDEGPVHEVCVDGFWMGKYEVTQGQWTRVMGSNPSKFKKGDDYPVEQVSWNDTKEFIRKLNDRGNGRFLLPTEAEWEYAARSGGRDETYAGGGDVDRVAWYEGNSGSSTHPVGSRAPNGLGLYDMSGNVWEWCEDVYDRSAYSRHGRKNPLVSTGGASRVSRGGAWNGAPALVRSAIRSRVAPIDPTRPDREFLNTPGWLRNDPSANDRESDLGFRLLRLE